MNTSYYIISNKRDTADSRTERDLHEIMGIHEIW